jgi:hypothetical protein
MVPHVKKGGGLAVKAKRGKAEEVSDCTTAEDMWKEGNVWFEPSSRRRAE